GRRPARPEALDGVRAVHGPRAPAPPRPHAAPRQQVGVHHVGPLVRADEQHAPGEGPAEQVVVRGIGLPELERDTGLRRELDDPAREAGPSTWNLYATTAWSRGAPTP